AENRHRTARASRCDGCRRDPRGAPHAARHAEFSRDLVDTTATTVCSARSHEAAGEPGVRAALVTDPEVRELSMVPVGRRTTCGVRPAPWGSAGRTVTWENVTGNVS